MEGGWEGRLGLDEREFGVFFRSVFFILEVVRG